MSDPVARVKALAKEATALAAKDRLERSETAKRNRERYPDITALMDRLRARGFPNSKVTKLKGAGNDTRKQEAQ